MTLTLLCVTPEEHNVFRQFCLTDCGPADPRCGPDDRCNPDDECKPNTPKKSKN